MGKLIANKKIVMSPFLVNSGFNTISVIPQKPVYAALQDFVYVKKPGSLLFEFFERKQEGLKSLPDWQNRIIVYIPATHLPMLFCLSDSVHSDRLCLKFDYEGTQLKIEKQEGAIIIEGKGVSLGPNSNVSIEDIVTNNLEKTEKEGHECTVKFKAEDWQLRGIGELAKFAHPYLLGWQLLNSLKYSEFEE